MSAFVVGREHINFLVNAALSRQLNPGYSGPLHVYHNGEGRYITHDNADTIGQELWEENIKSVLYRYPGDTRENCPGPVGENYVYKHRLPKGLFSEIAYPVRVLKAAKCYEYQACEHPEWRDSWAASFIDALKEHAIVALPGYEDAEWEVKSAA